MSHPAEREVVKLPDLYVFVLIISEGRGFAPLLHVNLMNKCLRIHCLSPFIVFRRWVESFFVEEVGGVSVFRRLRSGCEVDTVLQSAPTPRGRVLWVQ